jgi:trehalose 6-phosphate phosphatase
MTITTSSSLPASDVEAQLPPPPRLASASGVSVFLDFDGTLVEIADRPGDVVLPAELPQALRALSRRLDGRLAIVSGRGLATLDRMLEGVQVAMAGSHGGEFRPAGADRAQALAEPLPRPVCQALDDFAQDNGRLVFEAKPFSAAVHYRGRPEIGEALHAYAIKLGAEHDLVVKHGKMVVEVTMPGSDKGHAVTRFMDMAPFAGSRPLFVGDDVTDEDAFAAVRRFDGGGILVGPMRPTQALWRLESVAAVHRWLEDQA